VVRIAVFDPPVASMIGSGLKLNSQLNFKMTALKRMLTTASSQERTFSLHLNSCSAGTLTRLLRIRTWSSFMTRKSMMKLMECSLPSAKTIPQCLYSQV
jgi:hypothetical protein